MTEIEILALPRPELRRSPDEKRQGTRKEDNLIFKQNEIKIIFGAKFGLISSIIQSSMTIICNPI